MTITVKHKTKKLVLEYPGESAGFVKLYLVPKSYSDDAYYTASWEQGELEPVPACAVSDASLLAHFAVNSVEAGQTVTPVFLAEGVTHEN